MQIKLWLRKYLHGESINTKFHKSVVDPNDKT